MKLEIPHFATNKELIDFFVKNKNTLIAQKLSTFKKADGVAFNSYTGGLISKQGTNKVAKDVDEIKVRAVINTTGILDSHKDVHLPGLWKKSLSENKRILHAQEHKIQSFDKIIADGEDLKAYTDQMLWKELGYNADGHSQALVFDSTVKASRNAYMFDQYNRGYVKNHSVGMRYVKVFFAVNEKTDDYPEGKEYWEKYYESIVNKQDADSLGHFWAVTEAKAVEGSAVPLGSNPITPTLEPLKGTPHEAAKALQDAQTQFLSQLI